ncbi:hypothetical protein ACJ41O_010765 [Fusarium nematophilum]
MPSLKSITLSLMTLAPWAANAGHCKPSSTTASPEPTSEAPCPAYTPAPVSPAGRVCQKQAVKDWSGWPSYVLGFPGYQTDLAGCAKLCADTQGCVSLYVEMYEPREAPPFPLCYILNVYYEGASFKSPTPGRTVGTYYEFGCFECDRD